MPSRYPYQFAGNYVKYGPDPNKLAVDTHCLIALMRPDRCCCKPATPTAGPTRKANSLPRWRPGPSSNCSAKRGPRTDQFPAAGQFVGDTLGYYMHDGGHGTVPSDWDVYLKFMKTHLKPETGPADAVTQQTPRSAIATGSTTGIGAAPPASWIDPDTGHRVIRLTHEPGSDSFYFNVNSYTPDGTKMAYTRPNGISVLKLATLRVHAIGHGFGSRQSSWPQDTGNLYYTRATDDRYLTRCGASTSIPGENRKIADFPRRAGCSAINTDETLGAGTFIEGDAHASGAYDGTAASGRMSGRTSASRPTRAK